jgi:hypothetical protein
MNVLTTNMLFAAHSVWQQEQGVTVHPSAFGDATLAVQGFIDSTGLPEEYLMAYLVVHDVCHHIMLPLMHCEVPVGINDELQAVTYGLCVSTSVEEGDAFEQWSRRFEVEKGWPPLSKLQVSSCYLSVVRRVSEELGLDKAVLLEMMESI